MNKFIDKNDTIRGKEIANRKWVLSNTVRLTLLGLIGILCVVFLTKIGSVSTKGFEMKDLEIQKQELETETRRLEVQIAQYRSILSVNERLASMNMVSVDNPEYLNVAGSEVARR